MSICQICKEDRVKILLDCGPQPLCNRFVLNLHAEEYRHPLVLGQCEVCGLIQLIQPVPAEEIAPRFEWLTYDEPERHLDDLADVICSLPGITRNSVACGITYKDDTSLKRLENMKFGRTWHVNPEKDLGISIPGAGGESILPRLTPKVAAELTKKYGRPNVVIARHVYEHAPDTHRLLDALKQLVTPSGYVIFEVPDCTRLLDYKDYSMLWEEHILYFTQDTFQNSFGFTDFSLFRYQCYPYSIENALVAIVRPVENNKRAKLATDVLERELARGQSYAKGLKIYADKLQRYLRTYIKERGKVTVFGAGHLACMYINLMEIRDYIEFVVDDNPNKKGLYMPGSRLPIHGSNLLTDENISLCLLSLSPESEAKVLMKNQLFIEQGGTFASIFPSSENRLKL